METQNDRERVIILDTSLRDGEQQPDIEYTQDQKIKIASLLEKVGVDVIEAGYPAASPGEFWTVNKIAHNFANKPNVTICALVSTVVDHVHKTAACLQPAASKRIHTYIGTSPQHRAALNKTKEEIIGDAQLAVSCAKQYTDDVQFSAEDAIRTEREFLKEIFEATIKAGATTINVPDTVGKQRPKKVEELFTWLKNNVEGIDKVTLSIHCHNDLGNASANSIAAIEGGARQVECTINGYGERAGNTCLKTVVMNIDEYGDDLGVTTNINKQHLIPMERLLARTTGIGLATNRPGGENANTHKSGGHQSKMSKDKSTYEILDIGEYGGRSKGFVIDKLSGRAGVRSVLKDLGFESVTKTQLNNIYNECMMVADKTNKAVPKSQIKDIAKNEFEKSFNEASASQDTTQTYNVSFSRHISR